jgi:hypothetical protein
MNFFDIYEIYFNLCQNGKGRIIVILLSQTTHVLQHLNISCFKCLKTTFKKERYGVMDENNYTKPKKVMLIA